MTQRPLARVVLLLSVAAAVEAQPPVPVYEVSAGELSIDGSIPEGDRPRHLYRLGDANQFHMSRAESFADALLVPAEDHGTGVEQTTWGRLKGKAAAGD